MVSIVLSKISTMHPVKILAFFDIMYVLFGGFIYFIYTMTFLFSGAQYCISADCYVNDVLIITLNNNLVTGFINANYTVNDYPHKKYSTNFEIMTGEYNDVMSMINKNYQIGNKFRCYYSEFDESYSQLFNCSTMINNAVYLSMISLLIYINIFVIFGLITKHCINKIRNRKVIKNNVLKNSPSSDLLVRLIDD